VTTARSRPALRLAVASGVDLAVAIDAFLSQPELAATTRAKYRRTLAVVEDELGDVPVTGAGLGDVVEQLSRIVRIPRVRSWEFPTFGWVVEAGSESREAGAVAAHAVAVAVDLQDGCQQRRLHVLPPASCGPVA
jgi:hypothetical protein